MTLLATALACLATYCGPAIAQGPPAPSVAQFAISYERSGGLAAMPQKLVVRPGRHAVLTTRGPAPDGLKTSRFRVAAKRIADLRGALRRADFDSIDTPAPAPGACADCYLYALRYQGHEVSFSEVDAPERLRGVLDRLEALVAAHLPRH
jgi:hypothetical protein